MSDKIILKQGDSLKILKAIPDNFLDACITDPPYCLSTAKRWGNTDWEKEGHKKKELEQGGSIYTRSIKGFMGKEWDNDIAFQVELWREVFRVLKPGAHLLSFGGSRTYHRMACAIEDAGFEIRDQIMWVYGSGFPKSLNIGKVIDKKEGNEREVVGESWNMPDLRDVGKKSIEACGIDKLSFGQVRDAKRKVTEVTKGNSEWEGWGTALKPAHEPVVLARKPLSEKTIVENILKWGVGGLAIDNCRVVTNPDVDDMKREVYRGERDKSTDWGSKSGFKNETNKFTGVPPEGRFPANLIHDGSDEVVELFPNTKSSPVGFKGVAWKHSGNTKDEKTKLDWQREFNDSGSAARFFYCAKASQKERDMGCDEIEPQKMDESRKDGNPGGDNPRNRGVHERTNSHPTVKPISLMKYLVTLITKEGQVILDPFMGSGSTGIAAKELKRGFVGIELSPEYLEIAKKRINGKDNP